MTIKPCPVCKHPSVVFKTRIDPCDNVIGSVSCLQCCIGIDVNIGGDEQATKVATIRAWNSLSAPTDRRCGTCAHWEVDNSSDDHIRRCEGESEKFGTCMALPMVPETQNTALAESFGDRCAMWDLRGAE